MGKLAKHKERWFYLLISPWLIGFLLFQGGPILSAFGLSFVDWKPAETPRFVGLANFRLLLQDPLVQRTLLNTLYYSLGIVPAGIGIGLGLALLVNRRMRGVVLFRTVYFLPAVISGVATAMLWGWMFNPQYGLVNALLSRAGISGPAWLQDPVWAMPAMIFIGLWGAGTNMVLYLAALQSVPAELLEAAELDGANWSMRFIYIIWPLLTPVTFYLLIANMIGAFQVFTPIYVLTRGGPEHATLTLPLYIYLNAFSWGRMGYAASLSFVLFVVVMGLTLLHLKFARRWVYYAGINP